MPLPTAIDLKTLRYFLGLWRTPSIDVKTWNHLLQQVSAIEQLFNVEQTQAKELHIPAKIAEYLMNPDWRGVDSDIKWLEHPQHYIVLKSDSDYPSLLQEIYDAPPFLFVAGNKQRLTQTCIGVVGTRYPSADGQINAHHFAKTLSEVDITIVSGLARGIDAISHEAAMQGSGKTIAVMATGPDIIYPKQNRNLAHFIVDNGGVLVTELSTGTHAHKHAFPQRNRLISGMSLGVLVVEAAQRSGSLVTARLAVEQNRDVFAIPGAIRNPLSQGCHHLIRQGAKLVEKPEEVLEELPHYKQAPSAQIYVKSRENLSRSENTLYELIQPQSKSVDELIHLSELTAEQVATTLLQLELKGFIRLTPYGYQRL